MSDSQLASLADMRAANGTRFSDASYIHFVLGENPVASDFLGALVRLLRPEFEQIDGRFLVISAGAPERYLEYRRQGQSPSEAQFWANLTEITAVFESLNDQQAISMAEAVAELWHSALMKQAPESSQRAYMFEDEIEGEIFVTISEQNWR